MSIALPSPSTANEVLCRPRDAFDKRASLVSGSEAQPKTSAQMAQAT
jgi:hypothetical protein